MKRRILTLTLAALTAVWTVFAQEPTAPAYRIAGVEYRIDGRTRERPLRDALEIKVGKEFTDLASLEAYVAEKKQVLLNQRVLEDDADLTYTVGEASGGAAPVTLFVTARDTWNIIALPYPKYTTNDGFLLGIRLRDYNFLGSMETLYLDLDFVYDEHKRASFGLGIDFTFPFTLGGLDWAVNTKHEFEYHLSGRVTYTDEETLKLYLHGERFLWTLRLKQGLFWNEEGDDDDDLDKLLLQTLAGISTDVDIFSIPKLGPVTFVPDLEVGQKYRADGGTISEDRRGPYVTASYSLKAGRSDWKGNFREGTTLSLSNSYTYNFRSESFGISATLTGSYYDVLGKNVGLNSRLILFKNFLSYSEDIGDDIRGVPDVQIDGDAAVFFKFDLPVRLFDFKPSLVIKKDWLDFEVHASPFLDAAIVRYHPVNPDKESYWRPYLAGGLEVFGFLKRARSIYARLSVGVNALGYLETHKFGGNYELFFGLGHDY